MSTPLTDAITALTTYANETTGASDTTLSDAVESLVAGYGGGGGIASGTLLANWDFTQSKYDTVLGMAAVIYNNGNITQGEGIQITSSCRGFYLGQWFPNMIVEIDIGAMNKNFTSHGRLVMWTGTQGLIWRSSGYWQIYDTAWRKISDDDYNFLANKTIKFKVLSDCKYKIYVNDTLWYTSPNELLLTDRLGIGDSSGQGAYDTLITGVRIYADFND